VGSVIVSVGTVVDSVVGSVGGSVVGSVGGSVIGGAAMYIHYNHTHTCDYLLDVSILAQKRINISTNANLKIVC